MYVFPTVSHFSVAAYSQQDNGRDELAVALWYVMCSGVNIASWRAVFGAYTTKRAENCKSQGGRNNLM